MAGESDGDFAVARYLSGLETGVFEKPESNVSMLDLSPNPASDFLNIQLSETTAPPTVQVFDAQGRLVLLATGQRLDIQGLAAGIYSLRSVVGERVFVRKFVKQ
ncbi:MAG: T9SS type A sorting domain-containing protein [Saprospiraceae bacterium]|nr:T9SS type A sorting domain-containing protein [Saprospiraceae bacterium]